MWRRVFQFLSVASLVLCVVFAGLWIASYHRSGPVRYFPSDHAPLAFTIFTAQLTMIVNYAHPDERGPASDPVIKITTGGGTQDSIPGLVVNDHRILLNHASGTREVFQTGMNVDIRFSLLVAVTAVLPLVVLGVRVIRHMKRIQPGMCAACGYDLRASKVRCPECGAPIVPSQDNPSRLTSLT
jgi:hypothetical protein